MIAMREYVTSISDTNVRVASALGETTLNLADHVGALGVDTWRKSVQDGAASMKALLAAKDVLELVRIEGSLARIGLAKLISFYRNGYEIFAATKKELLRTLGAEFAGLNKSTTALLEQAGAATPGVSTTALQSGVAAVTAVVEGMDKAVARAAEMAEAKLMASVEADVKVVHVGLPRPKPRKRHEVGETSPMVSGSGTRAARKRVIAGE